jgi:ATP-dependent helicase/nuclease subunit A
VPPPPQRPHDSLLLWQVKREEKLASLAEELRLFYVAVTRARDTLLLVGSFDPDSQTRQERMALPPALGIPRARSCSEWVSLWLGNRVDWSAGSGAVAFPAGTSVARLRWRTHGGMPVPEAGEPSSAVPDTAAVSVPPADLPSFGWRYPHEAATDTPAKTSASALRRLEAQPDEEAAAPWPLRRAFPVAGEAWSGGKLSATGIGTAHHVFLEHLDLARAGSEADLAAEKARLCTAGVLRPDEADALDLGSIQAFWTTPTGAAIRQNQESVRRELAFTAAFSPLELPAFADRFEAASDGDFVVVQGAVDLVVLLPGEIWVLDFKTDRVSEAELPERAHEHERQLRLYAAALQRIYGRPVTRRLLHFLALGRSWEVTEPMPSLPMSV